MAQQIKLKRSAVSGKVPTTAQLQTAEIAINTADGKLFFKRDDTTIQSIITTNTLITGSLELTGPITGSDTYINDWGSISASLADLNSNIDGIDSSVTLQDATDNGNTTTNSITTTNSVFASTFTGSLLRISQNGSGLRMTNVGAFDNDGSDNFRIFSTNDLILSTNGDSGTAVTFDQTTKDATFEGDINTASTGSFGKVEATSIDLDSYTLLQSGKVTVNNGVLGVIGETYSGTTYAGLVMDYVLYDSARENQRTGTLLITANSSEAVYSENVTTDIGNTD